MRVGPWLLLLLLALPAVALGQRQHTVREGQSLARIAQRYQVSVTSLAAANELRRDAPLRPGMVLRIPEQGTTYVAAGDTLASISRDHGCSVQELQRLNRLQGEQLRIGQRLVLPGYEAQQERESAAQRWGRPRAPGVATLHRSSLDRTLRVSLVDSRGRARRPAIQRLQELMGSRSTRRAPAPPARLIELLARISDHFGGRRITIVSGYRAAGGYTQESSRHTRGHALDLRVQGVPNHVLRDYLRSAFQDVGVGYYPRGSFVHFDVRDRTTYWVDWSRRGEAPRYQRRGEAAPDDASAEERRHTGMGGDDVSEEGGEGAAEDE
ncbi:MAG: LysM peptidoglycan-binding domain-containing protein [Sandaracinaceae bacterium]|nr:LysM peptidoglycan-binding domain-containing protein [Sandaracinaceae bacterium]